MLFSALPLALYEKQSQHGRQGTMTDIRDDRAETGSARRLPAGRKAEIVKHLTDVGQITVAKLAQHFEVSVDTIRRDLDQLDTDGLLVRTHGGAVAVSALPRDDRAVDVRLRMQTAEKEIIAGLTSKLIQHSAVIMLNGGTSTLAVARRLREQRDLTIVTNNLRIPAEVSPAVYRDVYVVGGSVRALTQTTNGPIVFQSPASGDRIEIKADLAIIGVGAVSQNGYTTTNLGDAMIMAEMMSRSSQVAILADSTKFKRQLFAQIAELHHADWLVTDKYPPADLAAALDKANVEIVVPSSSD
ncbi:MAG: transcriptional regulator [Frondihabitans sp.]|nr:transcriptional regulator [Frondihabitans sp.]